MGSYVCHRNDGPKQNVGTMILVRRGIDHYSVLVSSLQQMETIALCVNFGGGPVSGILSPLRSLLDADLSDCFSGGKPILLAGDLNAKYKD